MCTTREINPIKYEQVKRSQNASVVKQEYGENFIWNVKFLNGGERSAGTCAEQNKPIHAKEKEMLVKT